jgi:acyl carrier protein
MVMEESRFFEIIAEYSSYSADKITMDMTFADDLSVDSLDLVDIISAVEDEFSIELTEEEYMVGIETVGGAYEMLKSKIVE